jgi:hypothetical protein
MDTSKETFKAFQQDDVLSTADVASNVVIEPEEEYAYGFIIEVLTSGLYPDVFHVIREYVQNSFDAIIAWLCWLLRTSVLKYDYFNSCIRKQKPWIYLRP